MATQQRALIVRTDPKHTRGLDELNVKLGRGWRVVQMTPLGGAATGAADAPLLSLAALVIIEREAEERLGMKEQVEEEVEEIVDEMVEGKGAKLPNELTEERNGGPASSLAR